MEKTLHDITRFIQKIAEKYAPQDNVALAYTDIHVRVYQDTGDVMAFDDDGHEITRVVVEKWINNALETEAFYSEVHNVMTDVIDKYGTHLALSLPYSYVLEDENGSHISELYVIDDSETVILGSPFMENLTQELDQFLDDLMKNDD